ncbi:hypothetical protein PMAYCL1PPCAC_07427, partial [Pristionchus mayeri]
MNRSCELQIHPFYDGFSTITLLFTGICATIFVSIFVWCATDMIKLHKEVCRSEAALSLLRRRN